LPQSLPVGAFDPVGYTSYGVNILSGFISKIKFPLSSAKKNTNSIFKTLCFLGLTKKKPLCEVFEQKKWNIQQLKRTTCWLVFVLKRLTWTSPKKSRFAGSLNRKNGLTNIKNKQHVG